MEVSARLNDTRFPWLKCYRRIEPLFGIGDKVKSLYKNLVRACDPDWRLRPLEDGIYTVQEIRCQGKYFDQYGYQIQLRERPEFWYWAWDFIKADLTGWIAPASNLMHINSCGMRYNGWEHIYLPCIYCGIPNKWMPKAYYFGGLNCCACRKWPRDHRRTRGIEKVFVESIARRTFSIGERVKPRYLDKVFSMAEFADPGVEWPGGSASVTEIWRQDFWPFEYMRMEGILGTWNPRHFERL